MIQIKNYEEDFLPQQFELVCKKTKNWDVFTYPNVHQLKQTYSADNFTPETRYYAFDGEELVGFLSSAFGDQEGIADLQFPFVKDGYDNLKDKLMERAFDTFRKKGVHTITTTLQDHWTEAQEILSGYGFEKGDLVEIHVLADTASFDYSEEKIENEYIEVDPVADKEELIRVFQSESTATAEQISKIIDGWNDPAINVVMNIVSKVDGRIVTHSMVVFNTNTPDIAHLTHVSIYDDTLKERRNEQIKFMFQRLKELGYKRIRLIELPMEEIDTYDIDSFKLIKTYKYSKQLL